MDCIPPSFGDLGKAARDLFDKDFDFAKVKLSLKTKPEPEVEFETNGTYDVERSRTSGNMKAKLEFPRYGVTFSETWNTNSEINTELTYEPEQVENLKLTLNSSFLPSSGAKSAKAKAGYKTNYLNVEGEVDLLMTGLTFKGAAVLMYNGWYTGYQVGYNTANAKIMANNLALGYKGNDFTVHGRMTDVSDCMASVHHRVSDCTEVGINTTYNLQTSNVGLGMVGKYVLSDEASIKAKVNNQGQIGVAYTQDLHKGVKLNLSGLVEGKNINAGGHKLGASLSFNCS